MYCAGTSTPGTCCLMQPVGSAPGRCPEEKETGLSAGRLLFAPFPGTRNFLGLFWGRVGVWGGLAVWKCGLSWDFQVVITRDGSAATGMHCSCSHVRAGCLGNPSMGELRPAELCLRLVGLQRFPARNYCSLGYSGGCPSLQAMGTTVSAS